MKNNIYNIIGMLLIAPFLHNQTQAMMRTARTLGALRGLGRWRGTAALTPPLPTAKPRYNFNNNHHRRHYHNTRQPYGLLAITAGIAVMSTNDDDQKIPSRTLTFEEQYREDKKALYLEQIAAGTFTNQETSVILNALLYMSLSPKFNAQVYQAAEKCISNHSTKEHPIDPTFFIMLLWRGSKASESLLTTAAKNLHTQKLVTRALEIGAPTEDHFRTLRDQHATLYRYYDDLVTAVAKWKSIVETAQATGY